MKSCGLFVLPPKTERFKQPDQYMEMTKLFFSGLVSWNFFKKTVKICLSAYITGNFCINHIALITGYELLFFRVTSSPHRFPCRARLFRSSCGTRLCGGIPGRHRSFRGARSHTGICTRY